MSAERSLIQLLTLTFQACLSLTSTFVVWPEGQREARLGPEFSGADGGAALPSPASPQILTVNSFLVWVCTSSCDIISSPSCGDSTSQFTWLSQSHGMAGWELGPHGNDPEMCGSAVLQEILLWGAW